MSALCLKQEHIGCRSDTALAVCQTVNSSRLSLPKQNVMSRQWLWELLNWIIFEVQVQLNWLSSDKVNILANKIANYLAIYQIQQWLLHSNATQFHA
jgi:hypothetical protein